MENKIIVWQLREMMNTEWWKYLTSVLETECDNLTNWILEVNEELNSVTLSRWDLMKSQRLQLLELIDKPSKLIDEMSEAEVVNMDV